MKKRTVPGLLAFVAVVAVTLVVAAPLVAMAQTETESAQPQSAPAQQPAAKEAPKSKAPAKEMQARVFPVVNIYPSDLVKALQPLGSPGPFGSPMMVANNSTKTISVRDYPENLAAIESVIRLLDIKPKEVARRDYQGAVEVQISLIAASADDAYKEAPVPATLASVVDQLRRTLAFKRYRYVTTLTQRAAASVGGQSSSASGSIASPFAGSTGLERPALYEYVLKNLWVELPESGPPTAGVEFMFTLTLSRVTNAVVDTQKLSMSTPIRLLEGEQVVVGSSSAGDGDKSIIVVLSIRRLEK